MIRVFHTGDVHLDSPFSGLSPEKADIRRAESRHIFSKMMDYASKNADIILIAGDLFDCRYATKATLSLVSDIFSNVKCHIVISPGNHDPYYEDSVWTSIEFPDNVHIFKSPKLEKITFPSLGVNVYGYGFDSSSLVTNPLISHSVEETDMINLVCAHGDILSPISNYAPISKQVISSFGADYTALGHIHNADELHGKFDGKMWAYCGCPEGHDFGECKRKYAILCNISKNNGITDADAKPIYFADKHYECVTVNADGASSQSEIISKIKSSLQPIDGDAIVRVTVRGNIEPSVIVSQTQLKNEIGAVLAEIKDETVPMLGADKLEKDMTVRGEAYRMLKPKMESSDEHERIVAIRAFRYLIAAMAGENISEE